MSIKVVNGLDLASQKITSVLDPTSAQDAATKAYVDAYRPTAVAFAGRLDQSGVGSPNTNLYTLPNAAGTLNAVPLNVEDVDTHNGHSTVTNNSRYTATVEGYYAVVGSVFWFNEANTTYRKTIIRKNGSATVPGTQALGAHDNGQLMSQIAPTSVVYFNGTTDYVELMVDAGTTGSKLYANATDGPMLVCYLIGK